GVAGSATDPGGGIGVQGDTAGDSGVGVMGSASATSGGGVGVMGITLADEGIGVWGSAESLTWSAAGVQGRSFAGSGIGVYGISDTETGGTGVAGEAHGTASIGVSGYGGAYGVWGDSSGVAVFGHSGIKTGVLGFAGLIDMGVPPPVAAAKSGVYGYSVLDATANGVLGRSTVGKGVRGEATTGIGGSFAATTGFALDVTGKARFSRSKKASIAAGKASLTVSLSGVTTASLIIAVLQTNRAGSYVQAAVPATGSFTIHLNKAVTAATSVAYLVLN
ncbi:MAG: hypothetical protein WCK58_17015, partial [Chloroflexota bacterium]